VSHAYYPEDAVRRDVFVGERGNGRDTNSSLRACRALLRFVIHVYKGFHMKICKLLLAAAGATVLLGALVSSASAGRFEINTQAIRSQWRSVEFRLPGGITRCEVTLEGTLHSRTMVKTIGSLIGYITRAILGPCVAGTAATILTETLPWHVRYSGFTGVLPEITSLIVHVIGAAFRVQEPRRLICLARSTAARPGIGTFHRDTVTHLLTEVGIGGTIPTGAECFGAEGEFASDSGVVSQSNSNTRVNVSLI
jgi:hypothetical protein